MEEIIKYVKAIKIIIGRIPNSGRKKNNKAEIINNLKVYKNYFFGGLLYLLQKIL